MPVLNVSFLNPALRKSTGGSTASILVDQLNILENNLMGSDGYLDPGDYDKLITKARELQGSPGLTASQRSDYDVRISNYEKNKAMVGFNRQSDIERMNLSLDNERAEDVMMAGNQPDAYLAGRVASYQAKLEDLTETIERKAAAGDDISAYQNEYNQAIQDYTEIVQAYEAVQGFDGTNPINGFVAYIKTNNRGEIVDVDYARAGTKDGYVETNGVMNGFQVYGNVNYKRNGENVFLLGNKKFSGVDMVMPDPTNPGAFKTQALVSSEMVRSKGGYVDIAEAGYDMIMGDTVPVQSYIPRNSWAKSIDGTYYHRDEGGNYSKYINVDDKQLNLENEPVITIPQGMESRLMRNSMETIDGAEPIMPEENMMSIDPAIAAPGLFSKPTFQQPEPAMPMSRAQQPKQPQEKAGEDVQSTAGRTLRAGVDFVKNIFR